MTENSSRRDFVKKTGVAGTAILVGGYGLRAISQNMGRDPEPVRTPDLEVVRIGMIGVGARGGHGHLPLLYDTPGVEIAAVCDTNEESARDNVQRVFGDAAVRPTLYTSGEYAYRDLLARDDIDAVVISTPWRWHTRMAVDAMRAGKHALVEVPAALTIEECWELVDTAEDTGKQCMMLENVCYARSELAVLNMCHQGVFGDLLHGEGAYIDEMKAKMQDDVGSGSWRCDHWARFDGNLYPTHGLGPIAQYMDINRGDVFDYVTSVSSPALGRDQYAIEAFPTGHHRNQVKYLCGDINSSLIKTKLGRTILVQFDTSSPRPYSRLNLVQGTRGIFSGFTDKLVLTDRPESGRYAWAAFEAGEYDHPLYTHYTEEAARRGIEGVRGMDGLMWLRVVDCLRRGLPLDQDVYDAASWSVLVELSQTSVAQRSNSVDFPDFTRGEWSERPRLTMSLTP